MIRVKQIDAGELQAFITGVLGGGSFANALTGYINGSGYFGPYIVYSSGGAQTIYGQKDFASAPGIPYSGESGQAISKKYVDDKFISETGNLYATIDPLFVKTSGDSYISGNTVFYSSPTVPYSGGTGQVVARKYVDDAITLISPTGVVNVYGNQTISGDKTFVNTVIVPTPSAGTHAANKTYVDTAAATSVNNVVRTSGNQSVTGTKTFISSPIVPVATSPNQAVQKAQLDALGVSMGSVSGFAGVLTLNGTSGASGHVYLEGAGTVSLIQCGDVFKISGFSDISGLIVDYIFASVPVQTSTYAQTVNFPSVMGGIPKILTTLEVAAIASPQAVSILPSNITTSGFTANFSAQITSTGYTLSYYATTGSGVYRNFATLNMTENITQIITTGGAVTILDYFFANSNLATGLSIQERTLAHGITFTGYSVGVTSAPTGQPMSGYFYQRAQDNTKYQFAGFTLSSGQVFSASGGFSTILTGLHRIGVDLTSVSTGANGLCVSLFGNIIV